MSKTQGDFREGYAVKYFCNLSFLKKRKKYDFAERLSFWKNRAGETLRAPAPKSSVVAANLAAARHLFLVVIELKFGAVLGGFSRFFIVKFAKFKLAFFTKICTHQNTRSSFTLKFLKPPSDSFLTSKVALKSKNTDFSAPIKFASDLAVVSAKPKPYTG